MICLLKKRSHSKSVLCFFFMRLLLVSRSPPVYTSKPFLITNCLTHQTPLLLTAKKIPHTVLFRRLSCHLRTPSGRRHHRKA